MLDVEKSPEFQAALDKVCEEEWKGYIYGDKRKAKAAEKLLPSVQEEIKETEKIKRSAESIKTRAELQMHGGGFRMFPSPMAPTLPENPSREDLDRYRTEMDTYSERVRNQAQMMSDPSIIRGLERFNAPTQGSLVCSECGDIDHGNKMNKTPWCMKCNCALEVLGKKGKKQPRIKRAEKKVPNILRGLP